MRFLDVATMDCTITWGMGDVVLEIRGTEWRLGVAEEADGQALAEAKGFLDRNSIVIDDDFAGCDVEDGMAWWVLTSDGVSFWKE